MTEQGPVVALQHLSVWQGDAEILQDVNLSLAKGELAYLIGNTGSGKTSLLKTLYADLPVLPGKGSAKVVGLELAGVKRSAVPALRRQLGIVFQDFQLFFDRTVAENLEFVLRATGWTDNSKMKHRQAEVLMQVGLGSVGSKLPHQLSGGEQQRVVIARALLNEPRLLIADEPTGNLDPEASREIMRIFSKISFSGTSVLMATHNTWLISEFKGRVFKVDKGTVTEQPAA